MSINGVPQLKEIVIHYGRNAATSSGVREFFKSRLIPYAKKHPHITIMTKPLAGNRQPHLWGHYLNGKKQKLPLKQLRSREVEEMMERLRNQSGFHNGATLRQWPNARTRHRSVQDPWTAEFNFDDRISNPRVDIVVASPGEEPQIKKGNGEVLMPGVRRSKRRPFSPLGEIDSDLLVQDEDDPITILERYVEKTQSKKKSPE